MMNFYSYFKKQVLKTKISLIEPFYFEQRGKWVALLKRLTFLPLAFILFITTGLPGYSQDSTDGWILLRNEEGIEAFYKFESCDSGNNFLVKFVNHSPSQKRIQWEGQIKSQSGQVFPISGGDILTLVEGQSLSGSCANQDERLVKPLSQDFTDSNVYLSLTIVE